jgi:hypothetical protein
LTRPVVGTVRDKDTGAPIAGVHITGMPNIPHSLIVTPDVEATSDAQGRYQVIGLSTVRGFKLFTKRPSASLTSIVGSSPRRATPSLAPARSPSTSP